MRTAAHEYYGSSLQVSISGTLQLPAPSGIGGVRMTSVTPDAPGRKVKLPDATDCPLGTVIAVHAVGACLLRDYGDNALASLAAGDVAECFLAAHADSNGTWIRNVQAGAALGSGITLGRQPWDLRFDQDQLDFSVHDYLIARGYDNVTPVAVRLTIGAGVVFGASGTAGWGLATGYFPAGSTLLLTLESSATITGKGGDGGIGGAVNGTVIPGMDGAAGGAGLRVEMDTTLVSYGYVQGGGGGGGGGSGTRGSLVPTQAGGGGGGGAGYRHSRGGLTSSGGSLASSAGTSGALYVAGGGGYGWGAGGTGGSPGTAGRDGEQPLPTTNSGQYGLGGAAGDAIQRWTAVTLTKAVAGTILGAETTF